MQNAVSLRYEDSATAGQSSGPAVGSVLIGQPALTIGLTLASGQSSTAAAGASVDFRATVQNGGGAPAYNTRFGLQVPTGMRGAAPTIRSATIGGANATLAAPQWNGGAGTWSVTLGDGQPITNGGPLVIELRAIADSDVGAGRTLGSRDSVAGYASLPSAGGSNDPVRRGYDPVSGPLVEVSTPSPTAMTNTVAPTNASIGEVVTFTLTVPHTGLGAALYDVRVLDDVDSRLRVTSITHNGAALGVTVTTGSSGEPVDLQFSHIPANQQAVVTVQAVVENQPGTVRTVGIDNAARFVWASGTGQAAKSPIPSPTVQVTVIEPNLAVTNALERVELANAAKGLQAGDKIVYRIRVNNTGDAPAHDFILRHVVDDELESPEIVGGPDNPGVPASSTATGSGSNTHLWAAITTPLAASGEYAFDIRYTVAGTVQPFQNMAAQMAVDYHSQPAPSTDRRGPTDGYTDTAGTEVRVTAGNASLLHGLAPSATPTPTVGEQSTLRLAFEFGEGQLEDLHLQETLPTGIEFVSATVSASNVTAVGGGPVLIVNGPNAGATGALDFGLDDLVSTAMDPTVTLDVVVRVQDVPTNLRGVTLTPSARATIIAPAGSGTPRPIASQSDPQVTVTEPALVVALDGGTNLDLGTLGDFTLRMDNTGDSAAHQARMVVELPAAARGIDPTTETVAARIAGGRALNLVLGTDFTVSYAEANGQMSLALVTAAARLEVGERVELDFHVGLSETAADQGAVSLRATATDFASLDLLTTPAVVRRYPAAIGTGTGGTPNATIGDDRGDDHALTGRRPVLTLIKSSDVVTADPEDPIQFEIVVSNTGSLAATAVEVTDIMNPVVEPGSLRSVEVMPTATALTVESTGGANKSGWFRATLDVAATSTVTIRFVVDVAKVVPNQSTLRNQASLVAAAQFTAPFVSDSARASDNDNIEGGNDGGDPNDDDPTTVTVGSAPSLEMDKTATDLDGAPLEGEDVILYTIVLRNVGNEDAVQTVLRDGIPPGTRYVAGSTTQNGSAVPDVGGECPLNSGLVVQSPSAVTGKLTVGQPVTVTFRVEVLGDTSPRTVIRNQSAVDARGDGNGTKVSVRSDDPSTPAVGDPTTLVVGKAVLIDAQMIASDRNGGAIDPGDTVRYKVTIRNFGTESASGVRFEDGLPANTVYLSSTMRYDADGSGPSGAVTLSDALDGDAGDFGGRVADTWSVTVGDLAAGGEVVIEFDVQVAAGTSTGTRIVNQGQVHSDQQPMEPTDLDGEDGNGDQPTVLSVGSGPALTLTKRVVDVNGGRVQAGDVLRFVLTVRNIGTEAANSVVLTDAVPPQHTGYLAGSTKLDGDGVPDVSGQSALVGGLAVGQLNAQQAAVILCDVRIDQVAPSFARIDNIAQFLAAGGRSGSSERVGLTIGGTSGSAGLRGSTWHDRDHDRTRGAGEPAQAGWVVELLLNGSVVATATTDSDGNYAFDGLVPGGGYELRFRHPRSRVVYGGPVSSHPGTTTKRGTIRGIALGNGEVATAQNLPLDPSGVVYDAVTRRPVPGAVVRILGPAGFDPAVHLLPAQAQQTTGPDGRYRFDMQAGHPGGVYRVAITPPVGYLPSFPSAILPPRDGVLDPTGGNSLTGSNPPYLVGTTPDAPQNGEPTVYYVSFDLSDGDPDVLQNHLPLDPVLEGSIVVTKTTPKVDVVRGELVPYRIAIQNTLNATIPGFDLIDELPPGFGLVGGSPRIDGMPVVPTRVGRTLRFAGLTLPAQGERILQMILVVGSGADRGRYINTAYAYEPSSSTTLSNHARAAVRVIPDPLFDGTDVIGKVFDDRNGNGYQDYGEPGIAGARVVTARGLVITTDAYGRYHITEPVEVSRSRGANFVLKLDPRSLPTGYRMTTENPRAVRLVRGKIVKANFGVATLRVVRAELSAAAFDASDALQSAEHSAVGTVVTELARSPSVLRLVYVRVDGESEDLVDRRMDYAAEFVRSLWGERRDRYPLTIEREVVRVRSRASGLPSRATPAGPLTETVPQPHLEFAPMPAGLALALVGSNHSATQKLGLDLASDGGDLAVATIGSLRIASHTESVFARLSARTVARYGRAALRFDLATNASAWLGRCSVRVFAPTRDGVEPIATLTLRGGRVTWVPVRSIADLPFEFELELGVGEQVVVSPRVGAPVLNLAAPGRLPIAVGIPMVTLHRAAPGPLHAVLLEVERLAPTSPLSVNGVRYFADESGAVQVPLQLPIGRSTIDLAWIDEAERRHRVERTVSLLPQQGIGSRHSESMSGGTTVGEASRDESGIVRRDSAVRERSVAPNAEHRVNRQGVSGGRGAPRAKSALPPLRVSVDGTEMPAHGAGSEPAAPLRADREVSPLQVSPLQVSPLQGSAANLDAADAQRRSDLALQALGLQMRYEGLRFDKRLNVAAAPSVAVNGQPVTFQMHTNYQAFLRAAEIRILRPKQSPRSQPIAIVPVGEDGRARWVPTPSVGAQVLYVVRAVGADGTFDQTAPKPLVIRNATAAGSALSSADLEQLLLGGYGINRLDIDAIPVRGGRVTIVGQGMDPATWLRLDGQPIAIDPAGRVAGESILPAGRHVVRLQVARPPAKQGERGSIVDVERVIVIPSDDWFYVGLADLTLGTHFDSGSGAELLAEDGTRKTVFVNGRVALYLKGKIKGDVLLTAMVDTGEQPFRDLLRRIDDKDPRQLLRRLDPDRYYQVYGDDSTTTWDAPTMGRFYVRLERGNSHVMWGSFTTRVLDAELAQLDRALYGAKLHWESEAQTESGRARSTVDGFVAEPETVAAREEFRGTGGSLYYARHQDVTVGSERARIEVRHRNTGLVLETRDLVPQEDYDFNYIQGRVLLSKPLPSTAPDGFLSRNNTLAGHPVFLVLRYEYRPLQSTLNNLAIGGRASTWIGESLRIGVTGSRDEQIGNDQTLVGTDVTLRHSETTYARLEFGHSEGRGVDERFSIDGGFDFGRRPRSSQVDPSADAWLFEGAVDFQDLFGVDHRGALTGYMRHREEGYSAPGQLTSSDTQDYGLRLTTDLGAAWDLVAEYDRREMDFGADTEQVRADLRYEVDEEWAITVGARRDDFDVDGGSGYFFDRGQRTDLVGAVEYQSSEEVLWRVFGQVTPDRSSTRRPMNRYGVGVKAQVSDILTVDGEVSGGNGGVGAQLGTEWAVSESTDLYLAYALGVDGTEYGRGQRNGTATSGARHRFSEALSVYGEERYRHGDGPTGLTHGYGLDYAPDDRWTFGVSAETGKLIDPTGGAIDRTSVSGSAGYGHTDLRVGTAVEFRDERVRGAERETWLTRNTASLQLDPDWRAIGKFNLSVSNGQGGDFFDGDFVEGSIGAAFRPVDNDRLNALFVYTHLADLPSAGQVTRTGGCARLRTAQPCAGGRRRLRSVEAADRRRQVCLALRPTAAEPLWPGPVVRQHDAARGPPTGLARSPRVGPSPRRPLARRRCQPGLRTRRPVRDLSPRRRERAPRRRLQLHRLLRLSDGPQLRQPRLLHQHRRQVLS